MIPFAFIITGKPVSLQINNRAKLQEWKSKVRETAVEALPIGMKATSEGVQVIITHYCITQTSDLDNIVKPIVDSMNSIVYIDDRQVTDLTVKRRKFKEFADLTAISPSIAEALSAGEEFIYVKIDQPTHPMELDR
ncbi:MAG: RusA family crossover junction endodeoxyribonuclease [Oscillatoriales cyanobacterium RU_3_3]|nr:RusA family crossover junction endodeoxyribonuclease [Microcoleus sp. SU_5_6]NJL69064.1 RusA family crossover junction endodeoxyribonuclease [Microcoleus sp. SM1_3_4]NJM60534.1 RusA family crossover junction endodeoxyribonuclease [Oscillatoriales cyanobacterium RU_3_3]NJR22730.1 RusA family crossover junction endodeoxyribonuclease [Richelia sp. CSU_2_1]NJR42127.1 RusA family crossover junction endodeoxyribonuclease [Akkermansiaceae bacterium]